MHLLLLSSRFVIFNVRQAVIDLIEIYDFNFVFLCYVSHKFEVRIVTVKTLEKRIKKKIMLKEDALLDDEPIEFKGGTLALSTEDDECDEKSLLNPRNTSKLPPFRIIEVRRRSVYNGQSYRLRRRVHVTDVTLVGRRPKIVFLLPR